MGHHFSALMEECGLTWGHRRLRGGWGRGAQPIAPACITQDPGMFNSFKEKHWRLSERGQEASGDLLGSQFRQWEAGPSLPL